MAMNNSPSKMEYNGHTHDFVGRVPDELMCKLCSRVLRDPRQVVCCGQHYCQSCIERRINVNFTCPSCRTPSFNHFRDVHFEQRVNTLKIHCPHHKRGCKWTGELVGLKAHLSSGAQACAYESAPCPNKCGQGMARKDIKEHLLKHCPLRRVRCQYCNHENTFQVVTTTHYSVCPNFPIKCPNNCGQKTIRRAEMPKHETQCPMKPVICPFQGAGCRAQLVQKDLTDHMTAFTKQHLDMVTKSFDTLRTRAENAERELQATKTEMIDIRRREESQRRLIMRKLTAIGSNADELIKVCTDSQRLTALSIKSLTDETFHLKKIGQPLVFQMINYSEFKRTGKPWYSQPFYVGEGYKMCLAVYADGIGIGQGSYLSVILCLMNGEFDDELAWPVELPFHLIVEILKNEGQESGNAPPNPKTYMYFHEDKPQERVVSEQLTEARHCENFARHDVVEDWMLFYDAITFQVTAESEFL